MEDLLGSSAMPSAATSVPRPEAGGRATEPSSARTVVPPAQDAGPARRERRAPGNNLLSDLVSPSTGGGAQRVPSAGAGNSLDPVSVLRQRASHRSHPTHYAAAAAAPVAVAATRADVDGDGASELVLLDAAGGVTTWVE